METPGGASSKTHQHPNKMSVGGASTESRFDIFDQQHKQEFLSFFHELAHWHSQGDWSCEKYISLIL